MFRGAKLQIQSKLIDYQCVKFWKKYE